LKTKLFLGFGLLCILPIGLMLALSSGHLRTIQDIAVKDTRSILIDSRRQLLQDRLAQEANRLSAVFSRLQDETYYLGSFSQTLLKSPSPLLFRSGSRYQLNGEGGYGSPVDDGNSVLYVPRFRSLQRPVIEATEALDLILKPLEERESRIVLSWIIHRNGVLRAYPWRNFNHFPKEKDLTSWPFYYLAGPEHNPLKKEVFTPVYLDPLSRQWMISCLYPVYVVNRHDATVGIDITIDNLLREISEIRLTKGSSSMLFSGTEIIAGSSNLPLKVLGLDPTSPAHGQNLARSTLPEVRKVSELILKEKDGIRLLDLPGQRSFVGHATVQPLGWKIVLVVPIEEFVAPANESAGRILAEMKELWTSYFHILVFILLGVIGISLVAFMHQSRGLRTLLQGIHILGEGNLLHRVPEDHTELGRLAKALNSMARSLLEKKAELQRVIAEVEQGRKLTAVGRLAAGVAHEVNNPLATISTYTQLLLRRSDLPQDVPKDLEKVMGEIRRIQSKLRDLLDLSRLQSPVVTAQDPNVIIQEIADLVHHDALTRNVILDLALAPGRTILIDRSGLKQVVWNLLGNALDAQDQGGRIVVRTFYEEDEVAQHSFVLEVEDEGPGIPKSVLPHIFEPFFTSKEVGKGTGLGLAVVYSIVKGHGGKIEVRNLEPKGCRFRVAIPERSTL